MKRRNFIQLSSILSFVGLAPVLTTKATTAEDSASVFETTGAKDRIYWVKLLDKIASPILSSMSKGELKKTMLMPSSLNGK